MSDIKKIVANEIRELEKEASTTLAYVLREVVKRLFANVSASWFYESVCDEIEVMLKP
jgi:hypothetical protein